MEWSSEEVGTAPGAIAEATGGCQTCGETKGNSAKLLEGLAALFDTTGGPLGDSAGESRFVTSSATLATN